MCISVCYAKFVELHKVISSCIIVNGVFRRQTFQQLGVQSLKYFYKIFSLQ